MCTCVCAPSPLCCPASLQRTLQMNPHPASLFTSSSPLLAKCRRLSGLSIIHLLEVLPALNKHTIKGQWQTSSHASCYLQLGWLLIMSGTDGAHLGLLSPIFCSKKYFNCNAFLCALFCAHMDDGKWALDKNKNQCRKCLQY